MDPGDPETNGIDADGTTLGAFGSSGAFGPSGAFGSSGTVAVFETIELRDGHPFALSRHLDRLADGAARLGLVIATPVALRLAVGDVARAWGRSPGRLRLTVCAPHPGRTTLGDLPQPPDQAGRAGPVEGRVPHVMMHAAPMTVRTEPVDVVVADAVHDQDGPTSGLKTAHCGDRVAALWSAHTAGADETLFANRRGELCEGATCNVAAVIDGEYRTPPLDSGCLPGITRALLLEAASAAGLRITERPVLMSELLMSGLTSQRQSVQEVVLISTGRLLQPVRSIDGRRLPSVDSPSTRELRRVFRATYADALDP